MASRSDEAGEASRIHNLVDDAGLPGGACGLVALTPDLDVFCLGFTSHAVYAQILSGRQGSGEVVSGL